MGRWQVSWPVYNSFINQDNPIITFNALNLEQNGCQFADDILNTFYFQEAISFLIKISLTFPTGLFADRSKLIQVITWHQAGNKPLSEAVPNL